MGIKKLTKDEFKKSSMSNYMSYRNYTNSKDMMDHPKPENKRPRNRANWTAQDYVDWGNENDWIHVKNKHLQAIIEREERNQDTVKLFGYVDTFTCSKCKKVKHRNYLELIKPLTIQCKNSCDTNK